MNDRATLLMNGAQVMSAFCVLNHLPPPDVVSADKTTWAFGVCAYYRPTVITICVARCAAVGVAGRSWSWPGYTVDRTPYGVLQHELGHHVDVLKGSERGAYWSEFSKAMRGTTGEAPITSYCPNDAEWFAEMFRVYVTNPDLLRHVRPRTHRELRQCFEPVFSDGWQERLSGAPERTINAARRHVERATA